MAPRPSLPPELTLAGERASALGFAQSPGLLKAPGFLLGVGGVILLVVSVWQLCAMVIAAREALD